MAEDDVDEEYLQLQAELNAELDETPLEERKVSGAGQLPRDGPSEKPQPPSSGVVIVSAKPVLRNERSATYNAPAWQQELYERDYYLSKMHNQRGNNGTGAGASAEATGAADAPASAKPAPAPTAENVTSDPASMPSSAAVATSYAGATAYPASGSGYAYPATNDAPANSEGTKKRKMLRTAVGETWEDPTLSDWPEDDFRVFVGDLAGDCTTEVLSAAFQPFPGFQMARVIKDKRTRKCKGYGFVSFGSGPDMVRAMKEMNGKYVGNRPVKLRKSTWQDRLYTRDRREEVGLFKKLRQSAKNL